MTAIEIPENWIVTAILLFARAGTLMLALPSMIGVAVPVRVRLLFAALLAVVLTASSPLRSWSSSDSAMLPYAMLREIAIGLMLSFSAALVMGAVGMAGELVGAQIELSAAEILRAPVGISVLGDAFMALAAFIFFGSGLQRALVYALARSVQVLPAGAVTVPSVEGLILGAGAAFLIGVSIALPLLIPLLMLAVAQGVLSRFAPQINLLVAAPAAMVMAGMMLVMTDASALVFRIDRAWTEAMLATVRMING
jgi:flagellar biosynthetic protein FliR